MHAVSLLFSAILALTLVTTVKSIAVPQDNVAPIETACEFPFVAFDTLEEPFTLTALSEASGNELSVALLRGSPPPIVQPFIAPIRFGVPPTLFRLTNGRLTTGGPNSDLFPAYYGPVIEIGPLVLEPLLFGGEEEGDTAFAAVNACDVDRNRILILLPSSQQFVVEQFEEGSEIFSRPESFQGEFVEIQLRINTDRLF